MKITNQYTTSIVTYDIMMDVGDEQEKKEVLIQYKEYMDGDKVIDEELFDENGGAIFDDELLKKVQALVESYLKED